jgi:hypothetical protein
LAEVASAKEIPLDDGRTGAAQHAPAVSTVEAVDVVAAASAARVASVLVVPELAP